MIPRLFSLPPPVGDVVHSEIYVSLMDMIKHLALSSSLGGGLSGVVKEPVRRVEESCGVPAWMWDFVFVASAACRGVIWGVGMGGVIRLWGLSVVG